MLKISYAGFLRPICSHFSAIHSWNVSQPEIAKNSL